MSRAADSWSQSAADIEQKLGADDPLTTKEGWRRFVDHQPDPPALHGSAELAKLCEGERAGYDEARRGYHADLPLVNTPTIQKVISTSRLLVQLNRNQVSARRGVIISGASGTGKTTALTQPHPAHRRTNTETTLERPRPIRGGVRSAGHHDVDRAAPPRDHAFCDMHQQHDALKAAGASKIYSDTMSGARDDRPGLAALMDQLRAGDTVVVWKLDRLGRNMLHILETVKALTEMGVTLVSTSDGIDSSTPAGRMMIGVLGSLAEYERELIRERTALKRESSRANGTRFGRPRKVDDTEHIATAKRMKADGHTGKDIAKYLGVSRATLYRYLTEDTAA